MCWLAFFCHFGPCRKMRAVFAFWFPAICTKNCGKLFVVICGWAWLAGRDGMRRWTLFDLIEHFLFASFYLANTNRQQQQHHQSRETARKE